MYNLVKNYLIRLQEIEIAEFNVGITGVTAIIARFMEVVTGITSPHLYTNFY